MVDSSCAASVNDGWPLAYCAVEACQTIEILPPILEEIWQRLTNGTSVAEATRI